MICTPPHNEAPDMGQTPGLDAHKHSRFLADKATGIPYRPAGHSEVYLRGQFTGKRG